ncbi:MAG: type I restriction endonuclease subunit M, partial [Dehalococcoidia bacterium]
IEATRPCLAGFTRDGRPKALIEAIGESLLAAFREAPLLDAYDVYQHLMDYWAETMQDDCYLIAADGWKAETTRIVEVDKKGKEKDKGWTCDLVPKPLIVAREFAGEQAAIDALTAEQEGVTAQLTELEEEHGGDEGVFSEMEKVNKASVAARVRELRGLFAPADSAEEAAVLTEWQRLSDQEAGLKKRVKDADAALDTKAYARYPALTEAEVKTLVVEDKWLGALDVDVHGEMDRVSRQLTQRVKELADRYETPMPVLGCRVTELEARVNCHLERMGFSWT